MHKESIPDFIRQISACLDLRCRNMSSRWGLTPTQGFCLMYIYDNRNGDFCSTDLCEILGTSRASVSLLLKGLKKKGYLRMDSVEGDDRKKQLTLTPKALEFSAFIAEDINQLENTMFKGIPPESITVITDGLKTMLDNLKNSYNNS